VVDRLSKATGVVIVLNDSEGVEPTPIRRASRMHAALDLVKAFRLRIGHDTATFLAPLEMATLVPHYRFGDVEQSAHPLTLRPLRNPFRVSVIENMTSTVYLRSSPAVRPDEDALGDRRVTDLGQCLDRARR
jgi:hypothetical protein